MDILQVWAIYHAGIASILLHPRENLTHVEQHEAIRRAAEIADLMILEYQKRKHGWHGSAQ